MRNKPKSAFENQTFWIYALIADSIESEKKACYIGQTVNLSRRLKEHYKNNRVGKSSYHLHSWARNENMNVKCVILSEIIADQQKASILENFWFGLAKKAGFETPNSDVWANSKNAEGFVGDYQFWPEERIKSILVELRKVVEEEVRIESI